MLGKHHYHFKSIDSTSAYIKRRRFVLPNFTFVSSDYQTNGRGRTDRTWESEACKNLLFSLLVKGKDVKKVFPYLSICSAVSIAKVLIKVGLKNVAVKWPNDVYVFDKKICGILLEGFLGSENEKDDAIVIGIGLNVNQQTFGENLLKEPTSILCETGNFTSLKCLKGKVYCTLKREIKSVLHGNFDCVRFAQKIDYLASKDCFAEIAGKKEKVRILGINDDCSLLINFNGEEKTVSTGEITFHI